MGPTFFECFLFFFLDYTNSWTASDAQLDCVSVKVDTQKLQSKDCNTVLPYACTQLPGAGGLLLDLYLLTYLLPTSCMMFTDCRERDVFWGDYRSVLHIPMLDKETCKSQVSTHTHI